MSRAFCIPGIVVIFMALVLNFLASISLPFLPALDITRTHFASDGVQGNTPLGMTELRVSSKTARVRVEANVSFNRSLVYGKQKNPSTTASIYINFVSRAPCYYDTHGDRTCEKTGIKICYYIQVQRLTVCPCRSWVQHRGI